MQRRHPRKSLAWCYKKYFTNLGKGRYFLQGTLMDRRGKPHTIRLQAADVHIKRHVKIKAAANPYDPSWETYFEERLALQMKDNQHGYGRLLKVWLNQNGLSPQCSERSQVKPAGIYITVGESSPSHGSGKRSGLFGDSDRSRWRV
jgi:RNA-directed DNA polymerase